MHNAGTLNACVTFQASQGIYNLVRVDAFNKRYANVIEVDATPFVWVMPKCAFESLQH